MYCLLQYKWLVFEKWQMRESSRTDLNDCRVSTAGETHRWLGGWWCMKPLGKFQGHQERWERTFQLFHWSRSCQSFCVSHRRCYEGGRVLAICFLTVNLYHMYCDWGPSAAIVPKRKHGDGEGVIFGKARIFLGGHWIGKRTNGCIFKEGMEANMKVIKR